MFHHTNKDEGPSEQPIELEVDNNRELAPIRVPLKPKKVTLKNANAAQFLLLANCVMFGPKYLHNMRGVRKRTDDTEPTQGDVDRLAKAELKRIRKAAKKNKGNGNNH